jgi:ABC-type nitrate/sulfonate/bicarbonate transport system permease component
MLTREIPLSDENHSRRLSKALTFVLPFLIVGTIWEAAVRLTGVSPDLLPAPSKILSEFWRLAFVNGILLKHFTASLYRLAIGYTLAVTLGVAVGALLSLRPTLRSLFEPVLKLLISVPTIAWLPALLITMGLGDRTVITTVFLGAFFAITLNTMRGIESVHQNLVQAAQIMGVDGLQLFFTVLLPGSLVSLITGLRLGIGYAWRALVGGEMLAAMITAGIGKMVFEARFFNDVSVMFVGILIIGLSGYLLDRTFLRWLEMVTIERWGMISRS